MREKKEGGKIRGKIMGGGGSQKVMRGEKSLRGKKMGEGWKERGDRRWMKKERREEEICGNMMDMGKRADGR